jgi:hypothetical protein
VKRLYYIFENKIWSNSMRKYLATLLVSVFLLGFNVTDLVAVPKSQNEPNTKNSQLPPIKAHSNLELTLSLAGIVLLGNEENYALIVDETTGRQDLYRFGDSIKGAKILKIDKDRVVIEREGKIFVLRVGGVTNSEKSHSDTYTENGPHFTGVSEDLPFFEPVFSETGPPVDANAPIEDLPFFEPVFSSTGPPVDANAPVEELPHFEPITNSVGPPVDPVDK